MEHTVGIIRNYKDTVFRMVFQEKRELLELYNAINGSTYTDPDELEIMTLENAVYMSMKNDVSCLLDMRLQLFEQQSTINPNMPLRDLMYVSKQYERFLVDKDIYSSRTIKLPTPKFIVFYNGVQRQPERRELRLSDAFACREEEPALELVVTQLNINEGYNEELLQKCPTLLQYMTYVNKIRSYDKELSLEDAVQRAIEECIREGILRDFLLKNKAEVMSMSIFEYDEELHKKTLRAEGYEDGYESGLENGLEQGLKNGLELGYRQGSEFGMMKGLVTQICRKLTKGKSPELIAEELEEELDTVRHICVVAEQFAPDYDVEAIAKELEK